MPPDRTSMIRVFSLAAGSMDAVTGLLLLAAPRFALNLFGAPAPAEGDDILMRFIGAFVLGVGLAYFVALSTRDRLRSLTRLEGTWGATAAIRASIALFTAAAVASGDLGYSWLVVCASDAAVAAVQFRGLAAGWFDA